MLHAYVAVFDNDGRTGSRHRRRFLVCWWVNAALFCRYSRDGRHLEVPFLEFNSVVPSPAERREQFQYEKLKWIAYRSPNWKQALSAWRCEPFWRSLHSSLFPQCSIVEILVHPFPGQTPFPGQRIENWLCWNDHQFWIRLDSRVQRAQVAAVRGRILPHFCAHFLSGDTFRCDFTQSALADYGRPSLGSTEI